ncbi:MAG: hypothetical protein DRJ49_00405 [Thermoprotei archaeon]|nr:MAG: hypothetical protein DRN53_05145 [Thermoprotei archaeon]RLE90271.1 MAG: hypothetical protein DRJ49_00405 [Thermoprotei archaeon]RLI82400.1 MAG: hypothetical protein DRP01_09945 [Archaeoglobales archaeon]
MNLSQFKDPKDALKYLKKERKRLEKEMELLLKKRDRGEIDDEEFNSKKREIERKFIEIMDRIAQMKYLSGV